MLTAKALLHHYYISQTGNPISLKLGKQNREEPPKQPKAKLQSLTPQKFYITTAINYTNGEPHFGHAYEAVCTDIITRYHRLFGRDVYFLTGTDEHGQKVEASAAASNRSPQSHVDYYASKFQAMGHTLHVNPNYFVRTSSPEHKASAVEIWKRVAKGKSPITKQDNIYLSKYEGYYNRFDEQFVTKAEIEVAPKNELGQPCDHLGRPYDKKEEEAYFFRMSEYRDLLLQYIEENPFFIQPPRARGEIITFLEGGLDDLCISRTTVKWGIPTPVGDTVPGHTMYVWFDALTNYLTGVDFFDLFSDDKKLKEFWPCNVHIIGKDIVRFHTVYWPSMLIAAGIPLPKCVFSHGFITAADGQKMGKSLGNARDPIEQVDLYGVDALRYYMARQTTFGEDLAYNEENLVNNFNDVLLKNLGNLVQRTCKVCGLFTNGKVPPSKALLVENKLPFDLGELKQKFEEYFAVLPSEASDGAAGALATSGLQLKNATAVLERCTSQTNAYLDRAEPWKKKGDEFDEYRQSAVRGALEAVYALAHFYTPFIPSTCLRIFDILSTGPMMLCELNEEFENLPVGTEILIDLLQEPLLNELEVGVGVRVKSENVAEELNAKQALKEKAKQQMEEQKMIKKIKQQEESNVVSSLDVRVGKISEATVLENGLVLEKVDLGFGTVLNVASGIGAKYTSQQLVGKLVCVVVNFEPFTPKNAPAGFVSQGMLLSGKNVENNDLELLEAPSEIPVGTRVFISDNVLKTYEESSTKKVDFAAICKSKAWEKIKKNLKIDENGIAMYGDLPFTFVQHEKQLRVRVKSLKNVGIF